MIIRLLIVDDHRIIREGLRVLLERVSGMHVAAEAADGLQAIARASSCGAHVVLMDIAMPVLNGIEATRKIVSACPQIKVVALSAHARKEFIREMLCAGASAYVLKHRASDELIRAIHEVTAGHKYLSPAIAGDLVDQFVELAGHQTKQSAIANLTEREREILQQVAEGESTMQMAGRLHVSVKTVETHRRNIMEKLQIRSVAQLTKFAIREGITAVEF